MVKSINNKRKNTDNTEYGLYSKIPPQALDMEECVLGALLIEKQAISEIADFITPQMFYVDAHVKIYECIEYLYSSSQPIDLMTITEQLRKNGELEEVGGAYYLSKLTNSVASSANIEYHARIIVQKYMQREAIRISNEVIRDAYEDTVDVFDLIENASTSFMTIEELKGSNIKNLSQIKTKIRKQITTEQPMAKLFKLGLNKLDFISKTFDIVAGFQGTGKTAFVLTVAKNLSEQGWKVGIISMEMSEMMLGSRSIQTDCSINSKKILTSTLNEQEKERIFSLSENKSDENIFVDDSTGLNNRNLVSKVQTFIQKYKVDIIFIDYLQMIDVAEKGVLEVKSNEKLSNRLQTIAKKFDVAIVGLSQLSRTQNGDKPNANSLRGGGFEQAATDIFILYDPFYKEFENLQWNEIQDLSKRGKIEVIYTKGRYTQVSNQYLYFDKPKQLMKGWDDEVPYESILSEFEEQQPTQSKKESFDLF